MGSSRGHLPVLGSPVVNDRRRRCLYGGAGPRLVAGQGIMEATDSFALAARRPHRQLFPIPSFRPIQGRR